MSSERRKILPLDKSVVNLIAAGEIIIAPSNALKELLENSIDAQSTQIEVMVKDGGVKLLQITDNGKGINKEDMPILCERFTTSKLVQFDDLKSIATYGFRGEALASISHIARVSVITKTNEDSCAWKASYKGGEIIGGETDGIKPVAGKNGTILVVEDLFYNVPSRLRALRSHNEEYSKIVEVVSKYSIHIENVGFNCQRQGGGGYDVNVRQAASRKDRIRSVYGSSIANNLIDLDIEIDDETRENYGLVSCKGLISNTSFENKKTIQPIFFINNRLVVCDPLRRAVTSVYGTYLPKGHRPFIYMSLTIKPENVDVNVHPTKKEVRFLNEEEIIELIVDKINDILKNLDSSRIFMTQQILTNTKRIEDDIESRRNKRMKINDYEKKTETPKLKPISQIKKLYEHEMVRSDYSQTTLNQFIKAPNNTVKEQKPMTLLSIKTLREEIESHLDDSITKLFSQHTYVGIADYKKRLLCLQYDVNLYLVDYGSLCYELFYQIGLADFSNFGVIEIANENDEGLSIKKLIKDEIYGNEEVINLFKKNLKTLPDLDTAVKTAFVDMKEMWEEYFNIKIDASDEGNPKLTSLPLFIEGYTPSWNKLSLFLFRVITKVNWEDEQECLGGILRQLALFYVPDMIYDNDNEDENNSNEEAKVKLRNVIENIVMPVVKSRFIGTDALRGDVIEIATLPKLYKVFERC